MGENFIICDCRHCGNGIEFDANQLDAGESRMLDCPHCGLETAIFRPTAPPTFQPVPPPPSPPPTPPVPQTPPARPGKKKSLLPVYLFLILLLPGLGAVVFMAGSKPAPPPAGYESGYAVGILGYADGLPQLDEHSLNQLAAMLSATNQVQTASRAPWIAAFTHGYSTAFTDMKGPFGKGYLAGWNYRKQGKAMPADGIIQALGDQNTHGGADAAVWRKGFQMGLGQAR